MFNLDEKLQADTFYVAHLGLSQVVLMNNQDYPWVILIPELEGVRELVDLTPEQRYRLMDDISVVSQAMQTLFKPDKLNVASIGNIVPQLHVHVVARRTDDVAWPAPVWGRPSTPYTNPSALIEQLRAAMLS